MNKTKQIKMLDELASAITKMGVVLTHPPTVALDGVEAILYVDGTTLSVEVEPRPREVLTIAGWGTVKEPAFVVTGWTYHPGNRIDPPDVSDSEVAVVHGQAWVAAQRVMEIVFRQQLEPHIESVTMSKEEMY